MAATPDIIKIMQAHFKGDSAYIPEMPDPALMVTSIPFDCSGKCIPVKCAVLDGNQYLSVFELLKIITSKNQHESCEVWRRLDEDVKDELRPFLKTFSFTGTTIILNPA